MEYLKTLWENHSEKVVSISYKALLVIGVFVAGFIVAKLVHRWLRKVNDRFERFDATLLPVLSAFSSVVVYSIAIVIILDFFGVNTASIIALLGAAGIAVGLALKDTLSNIAAGIMLLILRPFRTDEVIETGSFLGKVKQVGVFTTVLETPDGLFVSFPNSTLWGAPVKNYTRNGKRRMDVLVGISYSDSIDTGFEVMKDVIAGEERFLPDPAPQVMLKTLGESSVDLQLRAWAPIDKYWDVYWDTNKKLKEGVEAKGLTIPFPQRDVHMIKE